MLCIPVCECLEGQSSSGACHGPVRQRLARTQAAGRIFVRRAVCSRALRPTSSSGSGLSFAGLHECIPKLHSLFVSCRVAVCRRWTRQQPHAVVGHVPDRLGVARPRTTRRPSEGTPRARLLAERYACPSLFLSAFLWLFSCLFACVFSSCILLYPCSLHTLKYSTQRLN